MSDDKMRGALRAYCKGYEILPIHTMEEALDLWQAACATRDAEFINLHEVNRSLRDSNADMLRHFKSNEQQLAAKDKLLQVALEALQTCSVAHLEVDEGEPSYEFNDELVLEAITQIEEGIAADDIKFDDKSFCQPDGLPANPSANNDRLLELVKESGGEVGREWTEETSTTFKTEKQLRTFYELIRKEVVPEGYVVVPVEPIKPSTTLQRFWNNAMEGYKYVLTAHKKGE